MKRETRRAGGLVVAWVGALLLIAAGCASHTFLPTEDRSRLERRLPGRTFYTKQALYIGSFWGDPTKAFLSDGVPGEIPWVVNPAGVPMDPGDPYAIVPVGTRVRILRIEFPTSMEVATRNPFQPRYNPWVYLEVDGQPRSPTPILLLRRELRSEDEVMAEIERFLSPDDLKPVLRQLPEEVLRAVNEKRLVSGMPADAVVMAWGWPERKELSPSPEGRREQWYWPFDKRQALIVDGRLVSWEPLSTGVTLSE